MRLVRGRDGLPDDKFYGSKELIIIIIAILVAYRYVIISISSSISSSMASENGFKIRLPI